MYLNYYNYFVDIHLNLLGYFPICTCIARAIMVQDVLGKVFGNQAIPENLIVWLTQANPGHL